MSNPNFPVVTLAIWTERPNQDIINQISNKAAEMAMENKTDSLNDYNFVIPEFRVSRNWVNTSAANEWIVFVQGVGGPLASITIV